MNEMKVLLVRPPTHIWPYLNESDNFLLPQALPCLAAVLRENEIEVKAIDCMPLKIGWKSLRKIIERENPDVVGAGSSEALYSTETLRVFHLSKSVNSDIITVAGGGHFTAMAKDTLKNHPVDFVTVGEGEYTLLELVKELEKTKSEQDFRKVRGIVYRNKNGEIVRTPPRPLIEDLDELPLPAYDLMPMEKYGKGKYIFHPGGTTMHHSRGCAFKCNFCSCWPQMAERKLKSGIECLYPKWRTKSVERTMEELEILYYKYRKRGFVFTDDTWNMSADWDEKFADSVIERGLDINWFAFVRGDFIVRDERIGVLKKLVKSGMSHICVGVERALNEDLKLLNKTYSRSVITNCFKILKERYPQIFREATFIVGFRNETKESMLEQLKFAKQLDVDYPAFHPITPVPGTELREMAEKNGWIEIDDFEFYDWLTPVMSSEHLTREEIEDTIIRMNNSYVNPRKLVKGLLSPYSYKRNMYIWFLLVSLRLSWSIFNDWIKRPQKYAFLKMVKPKWYDK